MHAESASIRKSVLCKDKISLVETSSLVPYKHNARTHSRQQINQIARSIEHFGFVVPIVIDEVLHILAGHGRWAAAKLLGLAEVPAIMLSHLTEVDKNAFRIAENRLAELAGWDREILAIELQDLADLNFDVELIGFETAEIDLIFDEAREASRDENDSERIPPYLDKVVSQPGDLWQLGQHRLLCADARDTNSYTTLLNGSLATFVFTDPPYNVPINGHVCGNGQVRHREFAMACGEMNEEEFTGFLATVFQHLTANTVAGSIHDICMDWRHMSEMLAAGRAAYTELKNLCVWNKKSPGQGAFYRSQHELVFVWKNGSAPHINNFELGQHGRTRTNVWDYAGLATMQKDRAKQLAMHPTVKPVAMITDALKDCSRHGDIVLDPFAGSGTILIAAEKVGRKAHALEIDPRYVDVAIKRWQKYTGKRAVLADGEISFEEISLTRGTHKSTDPIIQKM